MTIEQIATDFGVHPMTLHKWMRQADIDEGAKPGTTGESGELRDATAADQAVGAGERGPASGRGLPVAGQSAGKRLYPLVKELAADGIPVAVTCRVPSSPASPTTAGWPRPHHRRRTRRGLPANALFDAHRDDPEFGYRYLVDGADDAGQPMAERTAWRICSDNGWWSAFGKRKRGKNGSRPPVHDDLVEP